MIHTPRDSVRSVRSMFDKAYPPLSRPGAFDVVGFYAGGAAFHVWTAGELDRVRPWVRFALPISLYRRGADPLAEADELVARLADVYGAPAGIAVCLDVEHYDVPHALSEGFVEPWRSRMSAHGFPCTPVYISGTDSKLFRPPLFVAHWTNRVPPHLAPGVLAAQYRSPTSDSSTAVDWSVVDDSLPLWKLDPQPIPSPEEGSSMLVVVGPKGTVFLVASDLKTFKPIVSKELGKRLIAQLPHVDDDTGELITTLQAHATELPA